MKHDKVKICLFFFQVSSVYTKKREKGVITTLIEKYSNCIPVQKRLRVNDYTALVVVVVKAIYTQRIVEWLIRSDWPFKPDTLDHIPSTLFISVSPESHDHLKLGLLGQCI